MVIAMKLSRAVSYALQTTLLLAREVSDSPVPSSRLATEGKMPDRFLVQILGKLVSRGLLRSTRGANGGYALARAPEDTSLLEVIEAIDGPLPSDFPRSDGLRAKSRSKLERVFEKATEATRRKLESVKLADVVPSRARKDRAKRTS